MEKKNIDWGNLGFGYVQTDKRYVSIYKNGAWDEGKLTEDPNIVLNECACVLQYAQTVFEGLKAYTTEDGHIVTFRPNLNASRMADSAEVVFSATLSRFRIVCSRRFCTAPSSERSEEVFSMAALTLSIPLRAPEPSLSLTSILCTPNDAELIGSISNDIV